MTANLQLLERPAPDASFGTALQRGRVRPERQPFGLGGLPMAAIGRPAGPLRVALFSGNYNCVRDGANQALNRLVEFLLRQSGVEVRVYSPTIAKPAFAPAGDLVSAPSIPIPGRGEYRVALGLLPRLGRDLARFAPNLVHVSSPDPLGRMAQRYARSRGIATVLSLHTRFETYFDFYGLGGVRALAERYLARFYQDCDRLLVPNLPVANEFRARPGPQVEIWGRGVDRTVFSPALRDQAWRRGMGIGDDEIAVLFFGRIVREKGVDIFCQALDLARARQPRLRPLIVGDGPARAAMAARLPHAVFAGHLSGQALGRAVASADIFLNPSVTEAFGNVTLEAMAAGVPIISAAVPSARALVEHERTALLVPPANVAAYVAALSRLAGNPPQRRAFAAAALADADRFDWEDVLADVLRVYRELTVI